jgi:hypothetical protein
MASASSLAHFNSGDTERVLETIEIDPQYATGLGLGQGDIVCRNFVVISKIPSHWVVSSTFRSRLGYYTICRLRNQWGLSPYPQMIGKSLSVLSCLFINKFNLRRAVKITNLRSYILHLLCSGNPCNTRREHPSFPSTCSQHWTRNKCLGSR